jgi:hypothetical protein
MRIRLAAQAAPRPIPATTSVSQCTPRYTRDSPTRATSPAAVAKAATLQGRCLLAWASRKASAP